MKLSILGHASFMLEDFNLRLITDPWLLGSCYWRSWWNSPYIEYDLEAIKPTHIYITHLHWDHYHLPSVRKLVTPETVFIIPKSISRRMRNDLREFKNNVIEADHKKKLSLNNEIDIISYQVNPFFLDSTLIIKSPYYTILNLNDSKPLGLTARDIKRISGEPTFMLRSYASASPIPLCVIKNNNQLNLENISKIKFKETYCQEFIDQVKIFKPKYAIPFASNHCYRRPDTKKFNEYATKMSFMEDYWIKNKSINAIEESTLICMENGSFFSTNSGFNLNKLGEDKNALESVKISDKVKSQIDLEKNTNLNLKAADKYFKNFLKSLNPIAKMFLPKYIIFKLNGKYIEYFLINFNSKNYQKLNKIDLELYSKNCLIIILPTRIFNDCNIKKMYNTLTPSKIVKFNIFNCNKLNLYSYLSLIDMYENELIPLRNLFNSRDIKILLSRNKEFLDYVILFFKLCIQKFIPLFKTKNSLIKL